MKKVAAKKIVPVENVVSSNDKTQIDYLKSIDSTLKKLLKVMSDSPKVKSSVLEALNNIEDEKPDIPVKKGYVSERPSIMDFNLDMKDVPPTGVMAFNPKLTTLGIPALPPGFKRG